MDAKFELKEVKYSDTEKRQPGMIPASSTERRLFPGVIPCYPVPRKEW